jgi:ribonucleoside-triphosphate reductase (thioredoxin)
VKLLTDEFVAKYPDFPKHMNELGRFVYYRTYSRWLPNEERREVWKETVRRAVEYNVGLGVKHLQKLRYPVDLSYYRKEAEELFDAMFNLRQFLSGRTLWVGGAETGVADKYPLANFNCSFINISKWDDLGDLFYLLMVGTGVGYKCTKEMARKLPPIRTNVTVLHSEYRPLPKDERLENTCVRVLDNGYAKIYVGDSKEGWRDALVKFFHLLTKPEYERVHTIKISYNSVRPKGERLKTFGGTASGPEPLREMFDGIDRVLKNKIDPHLKPIETDEKGYGHVRPIHILDIGNLVGNNVVVGGVRRTAEIFLFDPDDYESMFAKYGINGVWDEEQHRKVIAKMEAAGIPVPQWMYEIKIGDPNVRPLHHRRMSNNSVAFTRKPERNLLNLIFEMMRMEGEPGFVNLEELARRRLRGMGITNPSRELLEITMEYIGMNPCAEIALAGYGVCNLTTVNVVQFVKDGKLDIEGLLDAQRRSARAGLRMTLAEMELPHWDAIQSRDRLLGTSVTGWKDAMAMIGADEEYEAEIMRLMRDAAREEADRYARELRVTAPLLVTTVKPEGTISQVCGGVSSGLHYSHAPYYIRRIRINAADPLAQAVRAMGWTVHPEVGTPGKTLVEKFQNARTLVIDFPVASGAKLTKDDIYVEDQFETYFRFQRHYTEHNSSNTIHVRPDEWEKAEEIVWNHWDEFAAVSFLAYDGGTYELAPYETITKEQYEELRAKMKPFDPEILKLFEHGEDFDLGDSDCAGGACPIR